MGNVDYSKYAKLSPFELKDKLIALAESRTDRMRAERRPRKPKLPCNCPS